MHYLATCQRARSHLDRSHPTRFSQRHVGYWPEPNVLSLSRHRVVFRLEHEIGLPELFGQHPSVTFLPLFRGRHVLRVTEWRARINPLDDRRDLFIAQRSVVSEALDANGLVDMPRRHIASDHA